MCMSCAFKVKQRGVDPAIPSFFLLKLLLRLTAQDISAVRSKQIVSGDIGRAAAACFRLEVWLLL